MAVRLSQRITDWERPLVLYEVIPPYAKAPQEEVEDSGAFLAALLADHEIDAVNIPEVISESRNGSRRAGMLKRMDPRDYGQVLRKSFGNGTDVVVNHPTVYEGPEALETWLKATIDEYDTRNVVLVGGESSKHAYPGPGPVAAAKQIRKAKDRFPDVLLGAITIPTRRRPGPADEPARMLAKTKAGIDFFTSQVIFESGATRHMLRDYAAACEEAKVAPAPVFLSFAPITGKKDAAFLEWLGVEIPLAAKRWILEAGHGTLERSVRAAEHVLKDVLDYAERRSLGVPVGINVEHVMRYNQEPSEVLMERLMSLLEWKRLEREVAQGGQA